jgi:uncharacterized protein YgiM (DUF1202 family)
MKKFLLISALVLIPLTGSAADMLFVQSGKAKLMASPSFNSEVVTVAAKGDPLKLLEKADRWYQVNYNGKSGWVSKLLVSPTPPKDKISVIKETESEAQKENVRRRASSASTAAAARGLREDSRARSSDQGKPDWKALEQVESVHVDQEDINQFQQRGLSN